LNSFLVLNLVPDWVPFVEGTDLIPEVTMRNFTIGLRIIMLDLIASTGTSRLTIDWFWLMLHWLRLMIHWLWTIDWLWLWMIDWLWLWLIYWLTVGASVGMSIVEMTINIIVWSNIWILILIEDFTTLDSRLGFSISSIET